MLFEKKTLFLGFLSQDSSKSRIADSREFSTRNEESR